MVDLGRIFTSPGTAKPRQVGASFIQLTDQGYLRAAPNAIVGGIDGPVAVISHTFWQRRFATTR
jgi:hypothetical protein